MELKLYNFRCYTEYSILIPIGESLLIKGVSGEGKSTLLKAIQWVLYGKERNVTPKEIPHASTKVVLVLPSYKITRQRNPIDLYVEYNNITYQRAAAQAIIDDIFGTYEVWKTCCYIDQNHMNHIFYMSKQEKSDVLYKLAFGSKENKPEEELQKIDKLIKENQDTLKQYDINLVTKNSEYKSLVDKVKTLSEKYLDNYNKLKKYNIPNILTILDNKDKYISEYKELKTVIASIEKHQLLYIQQSSKTDTITNIINQINLKDDNEISGLESKIKNNEKEIEYHYTLYSKRYKSLLEEYPQLKTMNIKDNEKLWNNKLKYDKIKDNNLNFDKNSILKLIGEYNSYKECEKFLFHFNNADINNLEERVEKAGCSNIGNCPNCNHHLVYHNTKGLIVGDKVDQREDVKQLQILLKNKDSIISSKQYIEDYNNTQRLSIDELNILLSDIKEYEMLNKFDYGKVVPPYVVYEYERLVKDYKEGFSEESIEINLRNKSIIEKELNSYREIVLKNNHNKEQYKKYTNQLESLVDIEDKKEELDIKKKDFDELHKIIYTIIPEMENAVSLYDTVEQLERDRLVKEGLLKTLENDRTKSMKDLSLKIKLKDIIIKCIYNSLDRVVDHINLRMQEYLNAFFDSNIVVKLETMRTNKTTDIAKPDINFKITYNNYEYSMDELSGGEEHRINLAFTVAMNTMNNFPLLLLDECITSLDYDNKEKCLEMLQEVLDKDKTIINILHDTSEGLYTTTKKL